MMIGINTNVKINHSEHILFSRRCEIAEMIEQYMKEHNVPENIFNIITVLQILGGLKLPKEFSNKSMDADKK